MLMQSYSFCRQEEAILVADLSPQDVGCDTSHK